MLNYETKEQKELKQKFYVFSGHLGGNIKQKPQDLA